MTDTILEEELTLYERIVLAWVNGNRTDAEVLFRKIPVNERAGAALDLLAFLKPGVVRRLVDAA